MHGQLLSSGSFGGLSFGGLSFGGLSFGGFLNRITKFYLNNI